MTVSAHAESAHTELRRRPRRLAKTLLGLALFGAVATAALPAGAYTVSTTGSPGSASVPAAYASWTGFGSNQIVVPWRTVTESPTYAASSQYVCVIPRLWQLNNYGNGQQGWGFSAQTKSCAWIPAASRSVAVNGANFVQMTPMIGYSVDVVVTWQLANGTQIGKRVYDYSLANDYVCQTTKCFRNTSRIGGYVMFDF